MIKWEGERVSELEGRGNDREGETCYAWMGVHGVSDRLCTGCLG